MGYRFSYGRAPTVIMGDGQLAIRCGWDFQWEHEQGLSSEFVREVSGGKVGSLAQGEHCAIDHKAFVAGTLRVPSVSGDLLSCFGFGVLPPPAEASAYFRRVWDSEGPREPRGAVEVCWQPSSVVVWFLPRGKALRTRFAAALRSGSAVVGLAEPIRGGYTNAPEPYIATSAEFAERVIP